MDIKDIRLKNLEKLISSVKNAAKFAEIIGKSQSELSQIRSDKYQRSVSYDLAREIESIFNKKKGWMDQVHEESALAVMEDSPEYNIELPDLTTLIKSSSPRSAEILSNTQRLAAENKLTEVDLELVWPIIKRLSEK